MIRKNGRIIIKERQLKRLINNLLIQENFSDTMLSGLNGFRHCVEIIAGIISISIVATAIISISAGVAIPAAMASLAAVFSAFEVVEIVNVLLSILNFSKNDAGQIKWDPKWIEAVKKATEVLTVGASELSAMSSILKPILESIFNGKSIIEAMHQLYDRILEQDYGKSDNYVYSVCKNVEMFSDVMTGNTLNDSIPNSIEGDTDGNTLAQILTDKLEKLKSSGFKIDLKDRAKAVINKVGAAKSEKSGGFFSGWFGGGKKEKSNSLGKQISSNIEKIKSGR